MCDLHVDDILQRLSSKLKAIFCDREFVASVNEDLKLLSINKERCCVLVFPVLGPIFLRAIRYHAKILNFSAFTIGSGSTKAIVVCLSNYLVETVENDLTDVFSHKMSAADTIINNAQAKDDVALLRRNKGRPAMQLYVPPARRQRQPKRTEPRNKKGTQQRGKQLNEVPSAVANESVTTIDNSVVDTEVRLEVQDSPSLVAFNSNDEESEIINGKSEKDCVLSAPLSTVESMKKLEIGTSKLIISTKDDDEEEKEKQEIRRASERINRKKSIIKYIDNTNTLKIDDVEPEPIQTIKSGENLTNWEDMFDENDKLKEVYLEEIVKQVGNNVTILKANEDYSVYQNKKVIHDLDHVIELYDFPSSFKTCDIVQLYSELQCDNMYIKWVDDTHALLVLSTPVQAIRALQIHNDLVKSRPISEASSMSQSIAFKTDLKPAMKRPQTSLQTARRLITTHLGAKSRLSKEVLEQERKVLRDAREQKRQERQSERDAWEGNPRPSTA